VTTTGLRAFTPQYAAPEQWNVEFGEPSGATDLFALALVVVEMLTLDKALLGDTSAQLMYSCMNQERRPTPNVRGANVPESVERLFAEALALDPADRPSNIEEWWADVEAAWSARAVAPSAPGPDRESGLRSRGGGAAEVAASSLWRSPVVVSSMALAGLILIVAVLVVQWYSERRQAAVAGSSDHTIASSPQQKTSNATMSDDAPPRSPSATPPDARELETAASAESNPGEPAIGPRVEPAAPPPPTTRPAETSVSGSKLRATGVQSSPSPAAGVSSNVVSTSKADARTAKLSINSYPASVIYLNGRQIGNTPIVDFPVEPGSHEVVFDHPIHGRRTYTATVGAGETRTVWTRYRFSTIVVPDEQGEE